MKLVCGIGINDAGYVVSKEVNGKQVLCKFYKTWRSMLQRCYCPKLQVRQPTYKGCSVCPEWLTSSNFKSWMEKQDWEGNRLDKDLLVQGNKVYSPETCVFVSVMVNNFILNSQASRGGLPIGVSLHRKTNQYIAKVSMLGKGQKHLGIFGSPDEAYMAWLHAKSELAIKLAELQKDVRVSHALLNINYRKI